MTAACTTSWRGWRVCTQQPRPPACAHRRGGRPAPAGRAPPRRPGSGARAAPGRSRGTPPRRRASSWWSTASVPTTIRVPGPAAPRRRVGGDLGDRLAGQRLELLADAAHPDPQVLDPVAPQWVADHRADGAAPRGTPARPSSAWTTAASQRSHRVDLAAVGAAEQARPALAVEDAHHPAVGRAARCTRRSRDSPRAGSSVAPVDDLDEGQPARSAARDGREQRSPSAQRLERRARRRPARTARRPAGPARRRTSRACQVGACSCW